MDIKARFCQLFCIKRKALHWIIDAKHTAPTGEWCNVDGAIYHRDTIKETVLAHGIVTPLRIDVLPSGTFRVRKVIDGKRVATLFESLDDAKQYSRDLYAA